MFMSRAPVSYSPNRRHNLHGVNGIATIVDILSSLGEKGLSEQLNGEKSQRLRGVQWQDILKMPMVTVVPTQAAHSFSTWVVTFACHAKDGLQR